MLFFGGCFSTDNPFCLVTEFCPLGSLSQYLRDNAEIPKSVLLNILKGVAAGMDHLHREGLVHRDLAA